MDQPKLERLLRLMKLLTANTTYNVDQLAERLGVKVEVLPTSGGEEAKALLRSGLHIARRRR